MIVIKQYRSNNGANGIVAGVFSVMLPKFGNFIVHNFQHMIKGDQEWIKTPSYMMLVNGEKKFESVVDFEDPTINKKFTRAVHEALIEYLNNDSKAKENV